MSMIDVEMSERNKNVDLPSLSKFAIFNYSFRSCHTVVFESRK